MPTENRSSNTEQMVSVPLRLNEQQARDVQRFYDTCEDGQDYDVLKDRMKALARIGLVRSLGFGRYELTDVGCAAVNGLRDKVDQPAAQHQGEPVAWFRDDEEGREYCQKPFTTDWAPLYTHADAGEVERLREGIAKHWKVVCDQRAELDTLRAQLAAIAGWTTETRAAVLEAFQDELNESASYPWYDAAIADLMKLVEALPVSAEPSSPVERGPWQPITAPGQVQEGDWLSFTVAGGFICAQARLIINPGTPREEIIYNRQKNHFFVTLMAIDGTSTHKGVLVAKAQV